MTEHKPWLSLPDEEPPERGLAELLAAARVKAEVMANPPWWKRLFAVMRRPPVLALATVVVLLGGVIVVGRHHDEAASPAPSLDVPAGQLAPRARGSVADEPPPPAPVQPPVEKKLEAPPPVQAIGGEAQQAPVLDSMPTDELENAPRANEKAAATKADAKKAGVKKAADPLARCRAAAARRDCATAKACVKDLGNVDVGNDAALRSCL